MSTTAEAPAPGTAVLRRWPTCAGIAFAAFNLWAMASGADLAYILVSAGAVYLGAAAVKRRDAAWPMFFAAVVIVTIGMFAGFEAVWVLTGAAAALAVYGVVRGALRPADGLPLQTLAMAVIVASTAWAITSGGDLGAYLVAGGLLAHAGWDAYHHRAEKVVSRSLAEFCFVLDALLAVAIVVLTLRA